MKSPDVVLAAFQGKDKLDRAWYFQKTFLLADTIMEVLLKMPFLTFSNANIQFAEKELTSGPIPPRTLYQQPTG